MAYTRFHKSLKLLPGVRLNIAKTGPSLSLGPTGLRLNIGRQGTRTTLGLPGTGLSIINRKSWQSKKARAQLGQAAAIDIDATLAAMTKEQKRVAIADFLKTSSLEGAKRIHARFEAYMAEHPPQTDTEKADLEDARQLCAEIIKAKESGRHRSLLGVLIIVLLLLLFAALIGTQSEQKTTSNQTVRETSTDITEGASTPDVAQQLHEQTVAFIGEVNHFQSSPPQDVIIAANKIYADRVIYFGKSLSREEIVADLRRFINRWPNRKKTTQQDRRQHML